MDNITAAQRQYHSLFVPLELYVATYEIVVLHRGRFGGKMTTTHCVVNYGSIAPYTGYCSLSARSSPLIKRLFSKKRTALSPLSLNGAVKGTSSHQGYRLATGRGGATIHRIVASVRIFCYYWAHGNRPFKSHKRRLFSRKRTTMSPFSAKWCG